MYMLLRAKAKQFIFKICWNKFTIDSQRRKSPCYVLWSATRLIWQGACASSSGKTKSEYQLVTWLKTLCQTWHTYNVPASPTLFDRINWQISKFLKGSWKLTKLLWIRMLLLKPISYLDLLGYFSVKELSCKSIQSPQWLPIDYTYQYSWIVGLQLILAVTDGMRKTCQDISYFQLMKYICLYLG